jgi:hypothetical protein
MGRRTVGKLVAELTAKTDTFARDLGVVDNRLGGLQKRLDANAKAARNFGRFLVGAALGGGLIAAWRKTSQLADGLAKQARTTGIATEQLAGLRLGAELSGLEVKQLDVGLQRMVRRVAEAAQGTGEAVTALEELGLSASDLNSLRPDEQIGRIADALARVPEQGDRVRLSMKLFDRAGADFLNLLAGGSAGLADFQQQAEAAGITLSAIEAGKIEEANDAISRMKATVTGLAQDLVVLLAPAVETAATLLQSVAKIFSTDLGGAAVTSIAAITAGIWATNKALKAVLGTAVAVQGVTLAGAGARARGVAGAAVGGAGAAAAGAGGGAAAGGLATFAKAPLSTAAGFGVRAVGISGLGALGGIGAGLGYKAIRAIQDSAQEERSLETVRALRVEFERLRDVDLEAAGMPDELDGITQRLTEIRGELWSLFGTFDKTGTAEMLALIDSTHELGVEVRTLHDASIAQIAAHEKHVAKVNELTDAYAAWNDEQMKIQDAAKASRKAIADMLGDLEDQVNALGKSEAQLFIEDLEKMGADQYDLNRALELFGKIDAFEKQRLEAEKLAKSVGGVGQSFNDAVRSIMSAVQAAFDAQRPYLSATFQETRIENLALGPSAIALGSSRPATQEEQEKLRKAAERTNQILENGITARIRFN